MNLAPLLYFKYAGFLLLTISDMKAALGLGRLTGIPNIWLPLGISFFTFQGIAYLVDVVSGEKPFKKPVDFLLFKGFWPQLIAGPIIRPGEIRDQIENTSAYFYKDTAAGLKRILLGFLKKIVLADNLAPTVEMVFLPTAQPGSLDVLVGMIAFSLQIYFDFSAYTDIAIGSARLFGFRLPENFNWPYISSSPREFWSRWHMTLSRWIRDYLFTPMAFSYRERKSFLPVIVILAMALCGLWHGAAWTFVVWGIWHGALLVAGEGMIRLTNNIRLDKDSVIWNILSTCGFLLTIISVAVGWILFRSASLSQAWHMLMALVLPPWSLRPQVIRENAILFIGCIFIGTAMLHWARFVKWPPWSVTIWQRLSPFIKPPAYALATAIVIVADRGSQAFVYFQF